VRKTILAFYTFLLEIARDLLRVSLLKVEFAFRKKLGIAPQLL
jgi:hypothetical protein